MARKTTGIRERNGSWEAWVWDRRSERKIRKTFPTLAAAKSWRADASVGLRKGTMRAPTATTLRAAWDAWLEAAKRGEVLSRHSGPTSRARCAATSTTWTSTSSATLARSDSPRCARTTSRHSPVA